MTLLMDRLVVYTENMKRNLELTGGLVFSGSVLLALARKGAARDDAYRLVQKNAMRSWNRKGNFLSLLKKDKEVARYLSKKEIEKLFDLKKHLNNVDRIFKRVF